MISTLIRHNLHVDDDSDGNIEFLHNFENIVGSRGGGPLSCFAIELLLCAYFLFVATPL
jgi:hypothetical protein